MGCNTHIYLPCNVRIRDVVTIIATLTGNKIVKIQINKNAISANLTDPEAVKIINKEHAPLEMVQIAIKLNETAKTIREDDSPFCHFYWHWENSTHHQHRLLSTKSTNFWITIGKALVNFYGGFIDYNDCDAIDINYHVTEKSNEENCPGDGQEWNDFQNKLLQIKPLAATDYSNSEVSTYA